MEYLYSEDGRVVITGEGAIDYITLTTWEDVQLGNLQEIIVGLYGNPVEKTSIEAYTGFKYADFLFIGWGMQQGKPHHIMVASAYHSDRIFRHMIESKHINLDKWSCSRIDIQLTLKPKSRRKKLAVLGMELEQGKYGKLSNRRKIQIKVISSATGDTIYIGSPKSEKQKRIYDKRLTDMEGNNVTYERYEIQYRRRTAQSVMDRLHKGGIVNMSSNIQRIIKGDASLLPEGFQKKLSIYNFMPEIQTITINRVQVDAKQGDTTRWIVSIVYALIRACSQKGNNGYVCRRILLRALAVSLSEESLADYDRWRLIDGDGVIWTVAGEQYNSEQ